jgi:hypothetical protein
MPEPKFEGQNQEEKFDLMKPLVLSRMNYERHDPEGSEKLFEFEGDSNHVVRIENFEMLRDQFKGDNNEVEEKVKKLFDELSERYNIDAPVSFEGKGEELFIITDIVKGVHFEELDIESVEGEVNGKEFEKLCLSLVSYFSDKFFSNDPVLWDIAKTSAFVYGKKEGDLDDHIYLIDTDVKCVAGEHGLMDLEDVFYMVELLENKFGKKFESVRGELGRFLINARKHQTNDIRFKDESFGRYDKFLGKS